MVVASLHGYIYQNKSVKTLSKYVDKQAGCHLADILARVLVCSQLGASRGLLTLA